MTELKTKIGLEIHVQLATESKMFCRCSNNAENAAPNTLVCPVCLGLPGSLPVANRTAIEWTIKTGLALNCDIPATAKFDRKHYFYPDLPKGYQISQYDEPFCIGGWLEVDTDVISSGKASREILDQDFSNPALSERAGGRNDKTKIRLNRIHLEEDAGKLIHRGDQSLVDLNRAGTPLMEIVTEPDITTPGMAGEFLRKLQKIVRDVVEVSEASMEKGHLRCDANISVNSSSGLRAPDSESAMSQIIEIKNINSFRFVEKALAKAEEKLKSEYPAWPAKLTKETWGYNSDSDSIYLQRTKEEAADYRYFPEPDLPPIKSAEFDLDGLKGSAKESHDQIVEKMNKIGVSEQYAAGIAGNRAKLSLFNRCLGLVGEKHAGEIAKTVAQNTFSDLADFSDAEIREIFTNLADYPKNILTKIVELMRGGLSAEEAKSQVESGAGDDLASIVEKILADNPAEVARYKNGETKLFGFFVGAVMKETKGSADPQLINSILTEKL